MGTLSGTVAGADRPEGAASGEAGTPAPARARAPRTFSVGFHGADGATLRITATARRDGTATTRAAHTTRDGKRKAVTYGATEKHADMEAARAAVRLLAAEAAKRGWSRQGGGGFKAKPDAFDAGHLPAAAPKAKR
jgi:hypothetical protein